MLLALRGMAHASFFLYSDSVQVLRDARDVKQAKVTCRHGYDLPLSLTSISCTTLPSWLPEHENVLLLDLHSRAQLNLVSDNVRVLCIYCI